MAVAPTRTDAELVRRLQARDRTAWEELYAEYQPRLRAFGYRLAGNAHDADDLVQETFVRTLPALDRLDADRVDLAAYLFATEKNLFLKQVERAKRAEPTAEVPEPDLPTAIEDDPERSALLHRQQEEVRVANARLDARQRLVLALCELEDRSYAEIGELVGLKENAVAQLVFRARERLRTELRLVQVDPESMPEECRAFLPLLAQHLDGKLRGPKLETTLAHLEGCERCQAALADMREAKRRYRALLLPPLGVSGEQARAATEADLDRVGYWRGPSRWAALRRPRGATALVVATGAAVLLVASGVGAATLLGRTTQETAPSPTTVARSAPAPPAGPTTNAPTTTSAVSPSTGEQPSTSTVTQAPTSPALGAPSAPPTTVAAAPPSTHTPTVVSPRRRPPTPKQPKQVVPPVTTAVTATLTSAPPPTTVETATPPPDTVAPSVTFTVAPPASSTSRAARFEFVDAGVDDHSLAVRATDAAGNTGAPAVTRWTVAAPLPDLVAALTDTTVTVRNAGLAAAGRSVATVAGIGTFTVPGLGPGQSWTQTFACKGGTLTASADATRLVTESDEGNNTATRTVTCLGFGT